ncbi:unnamed protein product [Ectocarpus sp. 12 AP-2014]
MNAGALYTDLGERPVNHWAASYVQTADIDLSADHALITPIGESETDPFSGEYDGDSHTISNWGHTTTVDNAGLFGYVDGGTLKRIRLSGTFLLTGTNSFSGFLAGYAANATVSDIEGDFLSGSLLESSGYVGGLFGRLQTCTVYGVTVRGTVDFGDKNEQTFNGGVSGYVGYGSATMVRNLATFPNGITATRAGGVFAYCFKPSLSLCFSAMVGNVSGTYAGGMWVILAK